MKKNENKKFNLEKFEVAKLNNPKMIKGGDSSGICTTTGTDNDTSQDCKRKTLKDDTSGPVLTDSK